MKKNIIASIMIVAMSANSVIAAPVVSDDATDNTTLQPFEISQSQTAIGESFLTTQEELQKQQTIGESSATASILTYEDAVVMARNNSAQLRNYSDQAEYLQILKEDLWDVTGSFNVPSVSYQQWVMPAIYAIYTSMQTINSNMIKNEYGEEITKLTIEATVKNNFTSLFSDKSALELAKENLELQKITYEQGKRKNELGMISDYALQQLSDQYTQSEIQVEKLEIALEQQIQTFYNFIGKKPEENFVLLYDIVYEPYELSMPLEQYITNKLSSDYTLKLLEQSMEDAEFKKNYLSYETTGTEMASNELNFQNAQREYTTAKQNKELAIKTAYQNIKQLEVQHAEAVSAFEQALTAHRVAQINYEVGYTTFLTVQQATQAVEQARNAVRQIEYAHAMQIYQFENTELLATGSSAAMM